MNITGKRRVFPYIKQTGMMECGTTSLAMILKYYGYPNIQQYLAETGNVTTEGTNLYMLSQLGEKFGFSVDCYELEDCEYLSEVRLPLIAHFEGMHFVVIYKVSRDKVWIADPAFGKHIMTKADFMKKWNGVVMVMEPTDAMFQDEDLNTEVENRIEAEKSVFGTFYFPVFKKLKRHLAEILIGSLLLNLLGVVLPFMTQTIVDEVIPNQNKKLLLAILIALIANFIIRTTILYSRNLLMVNFKVKFELEFFSLFFKHFLSLGQKFYDDKKREDFISRFQESTHLREIVNPGTLQQFFDFIFIVVLIPFLFLLNVSMAWITLLFCVSYFLLIVIFSPQVLYLAEKIVGKNMSVLGKFLDALLGIKTVKLMGIERFMYTKWRNEYQRTLNVVLKNEKTQAMIISIEQAILFLSTLTMYWLGAVKVFNHHLTLGQYLAFIALFTMVLSSLANLQSLWWAYTGLKVSIKRINDIFIQEAENNNDKEDITRPIERIEMKKVKFKYNEKDENWVLNGLDMVINKGERIGIVGRNGTGKSTLVKLLVNLYPKFEGSINVNNQNIKNINTSELRKKIFLFPQDIYIYDGTIAENLRYANPDANMEQLIEAVKKADWFSHIQGSYLGFNQVVGNLGSNLSGGQILKLGFARLFLSNPDVIILDEASSQLDLETEKKIMDNLYSHFSDKTIISIAHRIHTLKNADKIFVVEGGVVAEEGTHEQLIAQKGIYAGFLSHYINY